MAQEAGAQNGTRESVGEMRADLRAIAEQVKTLTETVHTMDLRLAAQVTEFKVFSEVHLAYHKVAEQAATREREDRRWQSQRGLMIAGLAGGLVGTASNALMRVFGG